MTNLLEKIEFLQDRGYTINQIMIMASPTTDDIKGQEEAKKIRELTFGEDIESMMVPVYLSHLTKEELEQRAISFQHRIDKVSTISPLNDDIEFTVNNSKRALQYVKSFQTK